MGKTYWGILASRSIYIEIKQLNFWCLTERKIITDFEVWDFFVMCDANLFFLTVMKSFLYKTL